jgi:hypothetical protein
MTTFHSYEEFPEDAIKAFSEIIKKYEFVVESKSMTHILLSNETTQIWFDMDRYDLLGLIIQKNCKPRKKFGITQVVNHLHPEFSSSEELKNFEHHSYGERAINTLNWYAKIIEKYLKPVLKGNFNWAKELFRIVNSYNIKHIDFIYQHFENNHEIIKLYENEDGNWEPKLYKYLEENKIEI